MVTPRTIALTAACTTALAVPSAAAAQGCDPTRATPVPQPSHARMAAAGLGALPVAPDARRGDLVAPPFSNPTTITNPLFPISALRSVVLNGHVDNKPFRTETTLLPRTRIIEWAPGQCVRTAVSQYTAYLAGRLDEVALDYYAQADDGSVWYFGEQVFNYKHGVVVDGTDSWLAGVDGPAAMIMPAAPQVGQVSRAENIPGRVFEEVAVHAVGQTVAGPQGPVRSAMVARELHDDGTRSDKVFAPGYGEFLTHDPSGDLEALAVAVPVDALPGPPPAFEERLRRGALALFTAPRSSRALADVRAAWRARTAAEVALRLVAPTTRAVRRAGAGRGAALDLLQAALDLELRHRTADQIDRARFDLWARRAQLDLAAHDLANATGDVSTLEWIRDRIATGLDPVLLARVNGLILRLREHVNDGHVRPALRTVARIRDISGRMSH